MTIQYGTQAIHFEIEYTDRKSLGITVHPDASVLVIAPKHAHIDRIKEKILKRASWIIEQQRFFLSFEPRKVALLYKSGETHYYLGRQYLLKLVEIVEEDTPKVLNKGRYIMVLTHSKEPTQVASLLEAWYLSKATAYFDKVAQPLVERFGKYDVAPNSIIVRKMKNRWGSCTPKGNILLNPELIKSPRLCIEYVIIHELCHLIHPNHSTQFFDLLTREMPDWQKWKNKLEKFMA